MANNIELDSDIINMTAQITFPFDTDLAIESLDGRGILSLNAGDILEVQTIQDAPDGFCDLYLGNFNCAFNVPKNFVVVG